MKIGRFDLGQGKTFIIAEISCNHNGSLDTALEIVRKAKWAGANAIKLQTYTPDTITLDCDNEYFKIQSGTLWDGLTLHQLYQKAYTPWDWHEKIFAEARRLGMECFSSPFDSTAVDFLEELEVKVYKIASFEVTDHILLRKVASTGKPVILSTGITELNEIWEAAKILSENGSGPICILKCTSSYPAPIEDANLLTIPNIVSTFAEFNVIAGLSDHTKGIEVPVASVCLGAQVIEKHFTLDNNSGSPDDAFSLEPEEFKQMVDSVRKVEQALGTVKYSKSANEKKSQIFRRSLFICKNMKKGDKITNEVVRSVRPGYGLHTSHYETILGRRVNQDLVLGTPLSLEHLDNFRVLFLGETDNPLVEYLKSIGENVTVTNNKINVDFVKNFDFIISYGYRHIIRPEVIYLFPGKIINLHISYLPWNRGADPNLWSLIEETPKGVTIHQVNAGLDTGNILVQKLVDFDYENDTLKTSYQKLQLQIQNLFKTNWHALKQQKIKSVSQDLNDGNKHLAKHKKDFFDALEFGWDTPIRNVIEHYKLHLQTQ
jgi:pseudaminic acid synthase